MSDPIKAKALLLHEDTIIPQYNIFNRIMPNLMSIMSSCWKMKRSYEQPYRSYYIVFAPYKRYKPVPTDLIRIEKYCRQKFKYDRILITREILETSIHYNVMLTCKADCFVIHNTSLPKFDFRANVQEIPTQKDQERVLNYILKEGHERSLKPGLDTFKFNKL